MVHNGIIENHLALKEELKARRATSSPRETDTEVFAHLIADELKRRQGPAGGGARAPSRR